MNYKMEFMEWKRKRTNDFDAGKEAKAIEEAKSFYTRDIVNDYIIKC